MARNRELRSALFVDFDSVFKHLHRHSVVAAEQFVEHPARWLRWLERELGAGSRTGVERRRLLQRRCYMNPRRSEKEREALVRAAFEVVDCPVLTSHGKTSAGIQLALDALDAAKSPLVDEVILMVGEMDYSPLLLRARERDCRTVLVAAGREPVLGAAAADLFVAAESFRRVLRVEQARGDGRRVTDFDVADVAVLMRFTSGDSCALQTAFGCP